MPNLQGERGAGREGDGKNWELTKKYTKSVLWHTQHLFYHLMRLQPPVFMDFTPSHTLQEVHSALHSVLHSLAHPVGRTMSVEHSRVCCWVCVCGMQLVLSGLFTPPGGHSLYHLCVGPAPPTQAWTFNSRKGYRLISSVSTNEIYMSEWTNSFSVTPPWCIL